MLFFILLIPIFVSSQNGTKLTVDFKILKTNNDSYTVKDILDIKDTFRTASSFSEKTSPDDTFWILLDFKDKATIDIYPDTTLYLKFNSFDYGKLFYKDNNHIVKRSIGLFDPNSISKKVKFSHYYAFLPFKTKNLIQSRYLILKVKRLTFKEDIANWNFIYSDQHPNQLASSENFLNKNSYYFFAGLCLIMWFLTLSFFFMLKKPEFLFYSVYIILLFTYVAGNKFGIYQFLFGGNHIVQLWFSQIIILLANVAYTLFLAYYLETKRDYPWVHKLVQFIIGYNIVIFILISIFHVFDFIDSLGYLINITFKLGYASAVIALIYLIYSSRRPLPYIIAFASLAFCISSLMRMYFAAPGDGLFMDSLYYLIIGCSIEMIIFALGFNYKMQLEHKKNLQLQQEAFVNKTKALRAQINPHFIFNSLSSIQGLITKNDKVSAIKYLTRFSRLTRNILESSIETNVVLADEIKMIQDYLELESVRFDNTFTYAITVEKDIDINTVEVPFMILQPFVENAIIHGLLPKKEASKKITINFKKEERFITCEIDDNGIGRIREDKKENNYVKKRKSRGLEVTIQRMQALNTDEDEGGDIQIIDKMDKNEKSLGTKVILKFPYETH